MSKLLLPALNFNKIVPTPANLFNVSCSNDIILFL